MKTLFALCGLLVSTAFASQNPDYILPSTPVTIHATTSAYDAYNSVAKILGVRIFLGATLRPGVERSKAIETQKKTFAELQNIQVTLDLNRATGRQAFDAINKITNKPREALASGGNVPAGQIYVFVLGD